MEILVFLFLQFFIVTTSGLDVQVYHILDKEETKKENNVSFKTIDYNPKTKLRDEESYVFIRDENGRRDIIYWLGARAKRTTKLNTTAVIVAIIQGHPESAVTENVYITRETSKPGINTFEDLMSAKGREKIPRLYKVTGGHTIRQIPLKSKLNIKDSYVLDEGLSVTIHHSPTYEMNRKIAHSLAAYIINIENGGNYNPDPTSSSGDKEKSETAFNEFRQKISSIVNLHSKSKIDDLPKDEVGSSKAASKKLKAKDKKSTKKDDKHFESMKKTFIVLLHIYRLPIQTDTASTSSTSAAPIRANSRKKSKAAKGKTSLKENVNTSLLESEFTNAVTISMNTDSEYNKYKNVLPIFMGSEECVPKPFPLPIDTLKPMCIYVIKDFENYEIFIYLGKNEDLRLQTALVTAELDIDANSLWKVTIVLPGNIIPTAFMIHIKREMENYLFTRH